MNPIAFEVIVIAFIVSVLTSTISKILVDQKKVKQIQKQIKEFQKRYKDAQQRKDKELLKKLEKEQVEIMKLSKDLFVMNFKPTLITIIPIILLFWFLNNRYTNAGVVAHLPLLGIPLSWFWLYIIVAIGVGMLFELVYRIIKR
ncbi:hypothetical protein DRN74_00660 [Candidatus Micrarchaeota archaeon]|nr:MAG: hypothetical protein DRN74_00660 [Candidatus Micrarchaeota archaeon]